jgi:hypothetical protein
MHRALRRLAPCVYMNRREALHLQHMSETPEIVRQIISRVHVGEPARLAEPPMWKHKHAGESESTGMRKMARFAE